MSIITYTSLLLQYLHIYSSGISLMIIHCNCRNINWHGMRWALTASRLILHLGSEIICSYGAHVWKNAIPKKTKMTSIVGTWWNMYIAHTHVYIYILYIYTCQNMKRQLHLHKIIPRGLVESLLWLSSAAGNIANMVVATDTNLRSVLQYAVDVLQVRHIIASWRGGETNGKVVYIWI